MAWPPRSAGPEVGPELAELPGRDAGSCAGVPMPDPTSFGAPPSPCPFDGDLP